MKQWEYFSSGKQAMSAFGAWLKAQMDQRGWDGLRMQQESGVSDANISRYITRGTRPAPGNVGKIAKAFRADVSEVMVLAGYGRDLTPATKDEHLLIAEIRSFPWLRALVSDVVALAPQDQRTVRELAASLRLRGNGDQESPEP